MPTKKNRKKGNKGGNKLKMKSSSIKCCLVTLLLVSLAVPQINVLAASNSQQLPLPDGNIPVAILYSSGKLWMGGYWTGALFEVDNATMTLLGTYFVTGAEDNSIGLYGIAQDGDGNLWLSGRINGKIYKFNVAAHTFAEINTNTIQDPTNILYLNGFVYVACVSKLLKINVATNAITEIDLPACSYNGMCAFGANILITGVCTGQLLEVDTVANDYTVRVLDLHRPLNVAYDAASHNVYVAENVRWTGDSYEEGWYPAIATINSTSWGVSRTDVTDIGSPYAVAVFGGIVVWGSSAENEFRSKTINILGGSSTNVGEAVYYLAFDGVDNIFYSYFGSCGIGKIKVPQGKIKAAQIPKGQTKLHK